MSSTATILGGIFAALCIFAGAIYVFGIPPQLKRQMEEKALETMGENKMSYMMKDQISKVPASDQEDVKELKKGLGNAVGGGMQNPLGKFVSWKVTRCVLGWKICWLWYRPATPLMTLQALSLAVKGQVERQSVTKETVLEHMNDRALRRWISHIPEAAWIGVEKALADSIFKHM
jgi:hypothetical protein